MKTNILLELQRTLNQGHSFQIDDKPDAIDPLSDPVSF